MSKAGTSYPRRAVAASGGSSWLRRRTWAGERGYTEIASDALIDNLLGERPHRALGFVEVERAIHFRKDRQAAAPTTRAFQARELT